MKRSKLTSNDLFSEDLHDMEFVRHYLNEALCADEPDLLDFALQNIAKAHGISLTKMQPVAQVQAVAKRLNLKFA